MRRFMRVAQKLSLRTIKGNRVAKLQVAEIKGLVSLSPEVDCTKFEGSDEFFALNVYGADGPV